MLQVLNITLRQNVLVQLAMSETQLAQLREHEEHCPFHEHEEHQAALRAATGDKCVTAGGPPIYT